MRASRPRSVVSVVAMGAPLCLRGVDAGIVQVLIGRFYLPVEEAWVSNLYTVLGMVAEHRLQTASMCSVPSGPIGIPFWSFMVNRSPYLGTHNGALHLAHLRRCFSTTSY